VEQQLDEQPVETTVYSLGDAAPAAPAGEPERRTGERHLSLLRVGSLKIGERGELCLIKNISSGGMLIRAYCPVPVGKRLSVELKQGQPIAGVARWVRGGFAGIEFDEPIDVLELLSLTAEGPRPRMPRVEVSSIGSIREGAVAHRCKAINISQGGLKLESRASLDVGARVTLSLFGLQPCTGSVRWRDGDCYGITFDRLLPLPALVSWLQDERARLRAAG
jgi:hypothetical protein